jgi:hypothetical protein
MRAAESAEKNDTRVARLLRTDWGDRAPAYVSLAAIVSLGVLTCRLILEMVMIIP